MSEANGAWAHWDSCVPAWAYPAAEERPKFAQLVIPTLDSVRLERLLALVYSVNGASLLVGGPGTAKTATVNQFLGERLHCAAAAAAGAAAVKHCGAVAAVPGPTSVQNNLGAHWHAGP